MQAKIIKEICASFGTASVPGIARAFAAELDLALNHKPSSLKILPSFLSRSSGQEQGKYIAVDFGGTNIRVMAVNLLGQGHFQVSAQISRPLADDKLGYDLTRASATGRDLFDFVAALVEAVAIPGEDCALGLTFSYPMHQQAIDRATLLEWTKEIETSATVGRDIKGLFCDGLRKRGLSHVAPVAIINDTVAACLAGAYSQPAVCAGSICGTGHNSCYVEPALKTALGLPMVVNTEAGNFSLTEDNIYDQRLDSQSMDPGRQLLEKKVSGKYMGELFRLVIADLWERGLLPSTDKSLIRLSQPYTVGSEVLNWLSAEKPLRNEQIDNWLHQQGLDLISNEDLMIMRAVAQAIIDRAQHLIAASYIALCKPTGANGQRQAVAVDGSVFLKIPGFINGVERIINQHLEIPATVKLIPVSNGSILGAALAAAQVSPNS